MKVRIGQMDKTRNTNMQTQVEEASAQAGAVQFEDEEGNRLPSWNVPVEIYAEAHEGLPGDWRSTHMLVVARAIALGQPVPQDILDGHDPRALHLRVLRELSVCNGDLEAWEELRVLRQAGVTR